MGSFVAASIYLCFTLLYERRMRTAKEGVKEEGKRGNGVNDVEEIFDKENWKEGRR